jgi:hypothetical protein
MNQNQTAVAILALTADGDLDAALTAAEGNDLAVYVALAAVQAFDGIVQAFGLEPDHSRLASAMRLALAVYAVEVDSD